MESSPATANPLGNAPFSLLLHSYIVYTYSLTARGNQSHRRTIFSAMIRSGKKQHFAIDITVSNKKRPVSRTPRGHYSFKNALGRGEEKQGSHQANKNQWAAVTWKLTDNNAHHIVDEQLEWNWWILAASSLLACNMRQAVSNNLYGHSVCGLPARNVCSFL